MPGTEKKTYHIHERDTFRNALNDARGRELVYGSSTGEMGLKDEGGPGGTAIWPSASASLTAGHFITSDANKRLVGTGGTVNGDLLVLGTISGTLGDTTFSSGTFGGTLSSVGGAARINNCFWMKEVNSFQSVVRLSISEVSGTTEGTFLELVTLPTPIVPGTSRYVPVNYFSDNGLEDSLSRAEVASTGKFRVFKLDSVVLTDWADDGNTRGLRPQTFTYQL